MNDLDDFEEALNKLDADQAKENKYAIVIQRVAGVLLFAILFAVLALLFGCTCISADANQNCGIIEFDFSEA